MSRILILTASMGEGHNTAARNIREALIAEKPCEVLVADPYTRTNPMVNRLVQRGYNEAINRYPRAWKVVFNLLSRPGVVEGMGPLLAELTTAVKEMTEEFQPDILLSTYPVFTFVAAKLRKRGIPLPPLYTIITDSTLVNSSWYRCPCDGSIVADDQTANELRKGGVPENRIHILGFPVNLAFESLTPAKPPTDGQWKVILFPGGRSQRAVDTLRFLAEIPNVTVSVIAGKNKAMHSAIKRAHLPKKVKLYGWTNEMPQLMAKHHLFIGKAGGATVQEAIAAQIPFLVSHVVPGQEEGNISLIEQSGIGALAAGSASRVADLVRGTFVNDGAQWRAWRSNLSRLHKPSASRAIARFVLEKLKK